MQITVFLLCLVPLAINAYGVYRSGYGDYDAPDVNIYRRDPRTGIIYDPSDISYDHPDELIFRRGHIGRPVYTIRRRVSVLPGPRRAFY